jgi:acetyltransferase-like isoleucine patch superfamily enzyme
MGLQGKISKALHIDIFSFIKYNYLTKNIRRKKGCYIVPFSGTHIQIAKSAKFILQGNLLCNINKTKGSKAECLILLRDNARLTLTGNSDLYYGTTLQVHNGADLKMGEFHMNTGGTLICAYKITTGNVINMGRGVFIYDSDHHPIFNAEGDRINDAKEIVIGDNVWLGLKSTVMKGAQIGEGSVIGAHSLVAGNIPPHAMVATAPARPVMKDISWHR